MKVIATKLGYFGKLRQPGDEFDVPAGAQASWFELAEPVGFTKKKSVKSKPVEDEGDELAANGLV